MYLHKIACQYGLRRRPLAKTQGWLHAVTYSLPSRHFVSFSQVIIYRGGGLDAVWRNFAMVGGIGLAFI